jgi:hypothetical protein
MLTAKKDFRNILFQTFFYVTPGSTTVAAKNDHARRVKIIHYHFFAKVLRIMQLFYPALPPLSREGRRAREL